MKPETIEIIKKLLKSDVQDKKCMMLEYIERGCGAGISDRIAEYRSAYNALDDFEDWLCEQEE